MLQYLFKESLRQPPFMGICLNLERITEVWTSDDIIHNGIDRFCVSVKFENLLPRHGQSPHRTQVFGRYAWYFVEMAILGSIIYGGLKWAFMLRRHHVCYRGSRREMARHRSVVHQAIIIVQSLHAGQRFRRGPRRVNANSNRGPVKHRIDSAGEPEERLFLAQRGG